MINAARIAAMFLHARKCKKSADACEDCRGNIAASRSGALLTLALVLQDEPAIQRTVKLRDVVAQNTLDQLEGQDISRITRRSLREQLAFAGLADRVSRGEEIHVTHSPSRSKWERVDQGAF